jgi:hypothetical protein
MFTSGTWDDAFVLHCSIHRDASSLCAPGWSFNDSACSFFSSLAADSTFYRHFHVCQSHDSGQSAVDDMYAINDVSRDDVVSYVHSKILPSSCGAVEHMNIMYWTERFYSTESEQEARDYDERKKSEHRALIWPYLRSSYNDVNEFCSFISLYIFQVCLERRGVAALHPVFMFLCISSPPATSHLIPHPFQKQFMTTFTV